MTSIFPSMTSLITAHYITTEVASYLARMNSREIGLHVSETVHRVIEEEASVQPFDVISVNVTRVARPGTNSRNADTLLWNSSSSEGQVPGMLATGLQSLNYWVLDFARRWMMD